MEVGWIKVDQLAIKDSLVSLANKWIYIYTNYLQKKVIVRESEREKSLECSIHVQCMSSFFELVANTYNVHDYDLHGYTHT